MIDGRSGGVVIVLSLLFVDASSSLDVIVCGNLPMLHLTYVGAVISISRESESVDYNIYSGDVYCIPTIKK